MNVFLRRLALGAGAFVLIGVTIESVSPVRIGLVDTAEAIVGVAPGGSVVRRRTVYAATRYRRCVICERKRRCDGECQCRSGRRECERRCGKRKRCG